jgi:hypothetical protein
VAGAKRRQKLEPDKPLDVPRGFLDDHKVRKALATYLTRERLRKGPSALFDTRRHRALYEKDILIEVLAKIRRRIKKAGWDIEFSADEVRILNHHGHKS